MEIRYNKYLINFFDAATKQYFDYTDRKEDEYFMETFSGTRA